MSYLISESDDKIFYSKGKYLGKFFILLKSVVTRIKDVLRADSYSIIFIQREAFMLGSIIFERLLCRSKAKTIFDFDDAVWLDQLSEFSANKKLSWLKRPSKTASIIKKCDLVFAGNKYLRDYALQYNSNAVVVPTTIDTHEYKPVPKSENGTVCIGWSGSHTTIEHFMFAIPMLKKLKQKYGDKIRFVVIGDKNFVEPELNISGLPWRKEDEVKEINQFDIGIMPLPDQEWTKGKCGLKGLQYMAMGVATIMSPVGVNVEIVQDGVNGFLAGTEEEWIEKLSLLIENPELRKRLGSKGRRTVEQNFSVDSVKDVYLHYFNKLTGQGTPMFVISLDFELFWGVRDVKTVDEYKDNILGERQAIPAMLEQFQKYGIHATWASVGFLFFNQKQEILENLPSIIPNYHNKNLSPYEYLKEIGNNEQEDPLHYGRDLIRMIASYPNQEVASHSFSHYYCLEDGQAIDSFRSDLDKAVDIAKLNGFETKSYVFPRNQENRKYLSVMADKGVLCYRGNEHNFIYEALPRVKNKKPRRLLRLLDSYINLTGYHSYKVEALNFALPYNLPSSRYFRYYSPSLSFMESLKLRRIKKAMLHAAQNNEMYHIWWHPHNFGVNINENIANLVAILEYYQFLKKEYGMQSFNMGEIGEMLKKHTLK
jgi:glycosyltransferase involved in cell wall biosynthesis/peptidoglycan/xylan/chitin deacetylase (PgdA/CDA1 family)